VPGRFLGYAIQLADFRFEEQNPTYALVGFEQMLRRRQINGGPGGQRTRALVALPHAVRRALSMSADAVRWPFERILWVLEERLLWPLQERLAGFGLSGHGTGAATLGAIALMAILAGALLLPRGGSSPSDRVVRSERVAIATPEPQPAVEKSGPVLRGVTPDFSGGVSAPAGNPAAAELNAAGGGGAAATATEGDEVVSSEEGTVATSSSGKPVPAGPAAMKVARRFSQAFVYYEVGEKPARARAVFGETAAPQLAEALAERPPRQPANAAVPKARVLNLVPGPRAGKAYTVSVSLLRIGLTSELRLELNKKQGAWLVTDVRG
jgi:hypothetical protein